MLPRVWRERRLSGRRRGAVVLLLCAQEEMAFRVRLLQCCPPSDGIRDHLARVPSRLRPCAHEDGAFLGPRPRASAVNFREPPTPEVRGTPKFSRNQTVASRTRLLHFLAPFVATWRGYRRRSGRWCHCVTIFGAQRREIATANFYEKALFVKGDVATAPGLTQLLCPSRYASIRTFGSSHSLWWLGASWDPLGSGY
jgi:hypothetical protein